MPRQPIEPPLFCDRCMAELHPGQGDFFVVTIDAIADPAPPEFTDEDLQRDPWQEIQRLLADAAELSAREAMDQVHRRVTIFLCNPCYQRWIENPAAPE